MRNVCVIAIFAAALGQSAEMVTLRNGARFEIERSEREGDGAWLYSANGIQFVPARQIISIEEILPPGTEKRTAPPLPAFSFRSTRPNPTQRMIDEAAWRHGVVTSVGL